MLNNQLFIDSASVGIIHTDGLEFKLQEKDYLLRSVAHDLRNPLGGISSLTELLIQNLDKDPESLEMLLAIKNAAAHSLKLVHELLADGSSTNIAGSVSKVSLHQVIRNSVRLSKHRLAEKNQQLTLNLCDSEAELLIDKEQITRIVDNLVFNAIKFTGCDGAIAITTQHMSEGIHLMVRDNGIGIPDAMKDKVFDGSKEVRRKGTAGEASHGLGLSICRQIIESYGGSITFQSKPGKGTIFHIWLPDLDRK